MEMCSSRFVLSLTVTTAEPRRHGRHHRYSFPRYGMERIVPAPKSFAQPFNPRFHRRRERDEMAALIPLIRVAGTCRPPWVTGGGLAKSRVRSM